MLLAQGPQFNVQAAHHFNLNINIEHFENFFND